MRNQITLLLVLLLSISIVQAQVDKTKPLKVVTAAYFDETPPLREMKVILPGERDRSWKNGIIENKSLEWENPELDQLNISDPNVQQSFGTDNVKGPIYNIEGIGNVNGVYPPDTDGDVGPDHYFQMINLSFAIWDKNGNKLYGPVDNSTLWQGFIGPWTGTNDGDPVVLYDQEADRWIATQFALNTSNGKKYELVAISQTPDPTGAYFRYAFEFNYMNDYPKLGVWNDGYYSTYHMFSGTFLGAAVAVFERDSMLVGAPGARMVYFGQYPSIYGLLPADFDGPAPPADAPNYVVDMDGNHNMDIYKVEVDWNNINSSSFTLATTLSPNSYSTGVNGVPQPGTGNNLDDLAAMLMYRLQYRNFGTHETMVCNHTVSTSGRASIRWYELRKETGDWYIYQQGTYAPDNTERWMGSIAMNGNGTIAIGYSASSNSIYPSIRYVGRSEGAPLGTMNYNEVQVTEGLSSQTGVSRWGDYACLSVDPVDDSTFWFTTEYMKSSGWGTKIVSFDFSPISAPFVDAGVDDTACAYTLFSTAPIVTGQQSVLWETTGTGILSNPNNVITTYAHTPQDLENGSVMLKLTAYGYEQGLEASDSVTFFLQDRPDAWAGNDTLVCPWEAVLLNASVEYASGVEWSTNGDGTFDNDTLLNATYMMGTEDIANGQVNLTLTALPLEPCENTDSDVMKITIDGCTGIDEINDIEVSIVPNPSSGQFTYTIIGAETNELTMVIYNAKGVDVFSQRLNNMGEKYSNQIDMGYMPVGTYFIRISGENVLITKKILIQ